LGRPDRRSVLPLAPILLHEYAALDLDRVVEVLDRLEPIERFVEIVRRIESA
jgi:uncharacterized protein YutE (UPF0331/DUF86 family)